jgi:(p)ppGpp synthase/HD superfamily hydrolase
MEGLTQVIKAADAAARWHAHQRRKGASQEPYMNHLLEVASLVTAATDGREPDATVAALLHDAVEDQGISTEQIADQFGSRVAGIVMELTDDKSLPEAERKRPQVETARKKSREAKLIKLADRRATLMRLRNGRKGR